MPALCFPKVLDQHCQRIGLMRWSGRSEQHACLGTVLSTPFMASESLQQGVGLQLQLPMPHPCVKNEADISLRSIITRSGNGTSIPMPMLPNRPSPRQQYENLPGTAHGYSVAMPPPQTPPPDDQASYGTPTAQPSTIWRRALAR
jgi:hypothetical protein